MESRVKIAIQKNGRLSTESLSILKKCGIEFSDSNNKLFIKSTNMRIDLLMVRDDDIPRLVSQNIADLGIVGENVVSEKQLSDSSLKSKIILVLDEIDQLDSKCQEVLYTLFEWPYLQNYHSIFFQPSA